VRRNELIAVIVIGAVKLWIASARTLTAYGWSWIDDVWFLRRAQSIAAGQWLGA
jgi:hypothetical protein